MPKSYIEKHCVHVIKTNLPTISSKRRENVTYLQTIIKFLSNPTYCMCFNCNITKSNSTLQMSAITI